LFRFFPRVCRLAECTVVPAPVKEKAGKRREDSRKRKNQVARQR
jgi:hypothetical protein